MRILPSRIAAAIAQRLAVCGFAALASTMALAPPALAFDVVSTDRFVHIEGGIETILTSSDPVIQSFYGSCTQSVPILQESADAGAGSFVASEVASDQAQCPAPFNPPYGDPTLAASQDSVIDPETGVVHVIGSQRVDANYDLELVPGTPEGSFQVIESGTAETHFELVFEVTESSPFALDGVASIYAGGYTGSGGVVIQLEGPGSALIVDVALPTSGPPAFETVPIDVDGVLTPGAYTLRAISMGAAISDDEPFGFDGGAAEGSFDLQLTLPAAPAVPIASPALVAMALGAAGLAASRRLARRARA